VTAPRSRSRIPRLLVVLVCLVIAVIAADRITAVLAERAAATYLAKQAQFVSPPTVDVHGVPFLTQALQGRYRDVEVRSDGVRLDQVSASSFDVHLRGVHLPVSAAFGGRIRQLVCDSVDGTVTFSYAELVSLSKIPGLSLADSNGRLAVTATLAIPTLGSDLSVSGIAAVRIESGAVRLIVSQISVAGLTLPAAAVAALASTLATPIPIPALPFGVIIASAVPGPSGVAISGSGQHVVLRAPQ
jgi:hypothetical protein